MRVVSLLPAATEIVAALGGAGNLVGISHECDYPASVLGLPRVTATPIDVSAAGADHRRRGPPAASGGQAGHRRRCRGPAAARARCADHPGAVRGLRGVRRRGPPARGVGTAGPGRGHAAGSHPRRRVGRYRRGGAGARPGLGGRRVGRRAAEPAGATPRAGGWIPPPSALRRVAGAAVSGRPLGPGDDRGSRRGRCRRPAPAATRPGASGRSCRNSGPTSSLVALCGFGVDRARQELAALSDRQARSVLGAVPTWVLDGNAYTSRSGPRLVDGAELIQGALQGREAAARVEFCRDDALARWTDGAS